MSAHNCETAASNSPRPEPIEACNAVIAPAVALRLCLRNSAINAASKSLAFNSPQAASRTFAFLMVSSNFLPLTPPGCVITKRTCSGRSAIAVSRIAPTSSVAPSIPCTTMTVSSPNSDGESAFASSPAADSLLATMSCRTAAGSALRAEAITPSITRWTKMASLPTASTTWA